jgi:hypothetical protein
VTTSRRKIGYEDVFFVAMIVLGAWLFRGKGGVIGWAMLLWCSAIGSTQLWKLRSERIVWGQDRVEHQCRGKVIAMFPLDGSAALFVREVPGPERWMFPIRSHGMFIMDTLTVRDETKYIRLYPSYYTGQAHWVPYLRRAAEEGRIGAAPDALELLDLL